MNRDQILRAQRAINAAGLGPVAVDGVYGPSTADAYAELLRRSTVGGVADAMPVPAAAKPWWMSRAVVGAVSGILVGVLGLAGYSLDAEQLTGLLLALAGLVSSGVSLYGSLTRTAPIDASLVAPGYRVVAGLLGDAAPPGAADPDPAGGDDARGPFFDDPRR